MMKHTLLFALVLMAGTWGRAQDLRIIDQDYAKALRIAAQENKLVFVDFYTTWCGPCKQLDKLIFQNDSIQEILGEHFVLLRYDAERDTIHHLSKKHHISSYPTGLILNNKGYVLNRKHGFPGEDFTSLLQSVLAFTREGVELAERNEIVKGYSNEIDISAYPGFYIDYVNRTNTKPDSLEFANYWILPHDVFSEGYFSTLRYFAGDKMPDGVADDFLNSKVKYVELFGESDVNIALMFLSYGKFDAAISGKDRVAFDRAVEWVKLALPEKWAGQIVSRCEADFEEVKED